MNILNQSTDYRDDTTPSGFSILWHSSVVQSLNRIWNRLNDWSRFLLPVMYASMLVLIGAILLAVAFLNQHGRCWYDEVYMLDPAWHRATTGVWQSVASWDALDTIPYAPNYPLLCNILRCLIACFGTNFVVVRGAMLMFGLVPAAVLLWLFRREQVLQSRLEVILAGYFMACFSMFCLATVIRPEAVLISVATCLVCAWSFDCPVLLFICAMLVPLCGLQWNALLIPVALHWLVFGGRLRNPLLVAMAFAISSAGCILIYHMLGMWPSYLHEAARIGGLNPFCSAMKKIHSAFADWDYSWIFDGRHLFSYDALVFTLFGVMGGCACWLGGASRQSNHRASRLFLFGLVSILGMLFSLALLGNLNHRYPVVLSIPVALLLPAICRKFWRRFPIVLLLFAVFALKPAWVWWNRCSYGDTLSWMPGATLSRWADPPSTQRVLQAHLSDSDVVACNSAAYFEVRSLCSDMMPLCYAFDLSYAQAQSVTAVLLDDRPVPVLALDFSAHRRTSYRTKMIARFFPERQSIAPETVVSPDNLLAAIADSWNCTFTEIPLEGPKRPGFIQYRLFRPVFYEKNPSGG